VEPSVYFFPHSRDEFPQTQDLKEFLQGTLVRRDGIYRVVSAERYVRLRKGDIVVFHKGRQLIGEARVQEGVRRYEKPERVDGYVYEGYVVFDVKSAWIYGESIPFALATTRSGTRINPRAVHKVDWITYHTIVGHR
jgi:hypothetical protein